MASSGWWLARMPIEPTVVRVESISTSSLKTSPSGVRTSTGNGVRAIYCSLLRSLTLASSRSVSIAGLVALLLVVGALLGLGLLLLLLLLAARLDHLVDRALEEERPL